MAGLTREVSAAERRVTVRELTVREVRQWLADMEEAATRQDVDVVGEFMLEGLSFEELTRFCDITRDELDACTQGEVAALAKAAKELNPGFFRVRERLFQTALAVPSRAAG